MSASPSWSTSSVLPITAPAGIFAVFTHGRPPLAVPTGTVSTAETLPQCSSAPQAHCGDGTNTERVLCGGRTR